VKRMTTTEPANANVEKPALRIVDRERDEVIEIAGDPKQIVKLVAYGVFAGCSEAFARVLARRTLGPSPLLPPLPAEQTSDPADVMTADEVAEYLGVDRNTVYEYAARGAIPHKRLGKRMLFRRGSIVAWFDKAVVEGER
jgi:excisionase family DNA binding protein